MRMCLAQHGHRIILRARATVSFRRRVAIEFEVCRSGRTGGLIGSGTAGNGRFLAAFGTGQVLRGNSLPFGEEEAVSRYAETGVVVEASPTPALVMTKTQLLLQFAIIPFNPPP